jgi:hypothetical protein
MENPFDDNFFNNVNKTLEALDDAAEKQAHDSRYTADGVLLEKGLKVWCVDNSLGGEPWTVRSYQKNYGTWFIVFDEGRKGKRDARYSVMYACKPKAISARMDVIHAQIMKITKDEITPKKEEIRRLMRMAVEDLDNE